MWNQQVTRFLISEHFLNVKVEYNMSLLIYIKRMLWSSSRRRGSMLVEASSSMRSHLHGNNDKKNQCLDRYFSVLFLAVALVLFGHLTYAVEENGVEFNESVQLDDGSTLVLNGTGTRRKWFVKVYAAALYLPSHSSDADTVIAMPGPKQINMVFIYKEVERKKLLATLDEGFKNNHTEEQLAILAEPLDQLKSFFKTVKKGDEVLLRYTDALGTEVLFNNELQGVIKGFDFQQAMFRVWLGEKPADKTLKKGMLGLSK